MKVNGLQQAADLMNSLDEETFRRIMGELALKDPTLADQIRKAMFRIDSLINCTDEDIQKLIQSVPRPVLLPALRGVTSELRERVFRALPARMQENIAQEIVELGLVKKIESEVAQQKVAEIAKTLGIKHKSKA